MAVWISPQSSKIWMKLEYFHNLQGRLVSKAEKWCPIVSDSFLDLDKRFFERILEEYAGRSTGNSFIVCIGSQDGYSEQYWTPTAPNWQISIECDRIIVLQWISCWYFENIPFFTNSNMKISVNCTQIVAFNSPNKNIEYLSIFITYFCIHKEKEGENVRNTQFVKIQNENLCK